MAHEKFKILVAEDDPDFRLEVGASLARSGYTVVTVEDGYQALEYAVRENPDLLVLDVHMPAGDGFSVHERVLKHPELALKPVIYMTRDHSSETADGAHSHHAYALLYKPFEIEYLIEQVGAALRESGQKAA